MAASLPAHVEEADLISYGLIGLIAAVERFDLSREIKFETFAITRIKGSIIDELRSLDWVPRSVRARAREIERVNAKLEHELRRAPSDAEMATELEMSVEDFQDALTQISNSSVIALDELWTLSDASGDQVSRSTPSRTQTPLTWRASSTPARCASGSRTRSPGCPSARSSSSPSTTTRT